MSPNVLSIFNNAKIFLSESEMKELAACIDKEFGKEKTKRKRVTSNNINAYTLESVTERLLTKQFNKKRAKKPLQ